MNIDYNDLEGDQQKAYDLAFNPQEGITRIVGYAGTGKTTVMAAVAKALGKRCEVLSPTNKAALNLRKKGISRARTIHSCLYIPHEIEIYKEDKDGNTIYLKKENGEYKLDDDGLKIPELLRKEMAFGLKEVGPDDNIPPIVLVDESSMVTLEILEDLGTFFSYIVLFGDDFQLPPVSKNKTSALDNGADDIKLTKVHRVAEGNPIIIYATKIRNNEEPNIKDIAKKGTEICFCKWGNSHLYDSIVKNNMQAISYRNQTRHYVNERIRMTKGLEKNKLVAGELIVCNQNVYEIHDDG